MKSKAPAERSSDIHIGWAHRLDGLRISDALIGFPYELGIPFVPINFPAVFAVTVIWTW